MAGRLAERGVKPQLILSSPATRALTTAQGFARKLDYPKQEIRVEERLYSGHVRDLLDVLHGVGDDVHRVFLVAHNPHLTQLAQQLCGDIGHLPPCAIAEFTFDAKSWADVGETKARRSRLECPYEAST